MARGTKVISIFKWRSQGREFVLASQLTHLQSTCQGDSTEPNQVLTAQWHSPQPCKVLYADCLIPKAGLLLLGYPVFPNCPSHNDTELRKNDVTCPWGCPGGTESGNLRTGASGLQQWLWVSKSDWLLAMIKSGGDKAVIWVSRSMDKGREMTVNMQKLTKKVLIFASLRPNLIKSKSLKPTIGYGK